MGAVITVGFIILAWSQTEASNYNNAYSSVIKSDTDQLRERIIFEHIYYNGTHITVYLMNSGTIGDVNIANVYVDDTAYGAPQKLYFLKDDTETSSLDTTQEGYFAISLSLVLDTDYPIRIVTGRGSSFVATFKA